MAGQRDIVAELLEKLGLDPETVPAETRAALSRSLNPTPEGAPMSSTETLEEATARLNQHMTTRREQIHANRRLTPQEQRRMIAREWQKVYAEHTQHGATVAENVDLEYQAIELHHWSAPCAAFKPTDAEQNSYRTARDRVAGLGDAALLTELQDALAIGDTVVARAVAYEGFRRQRTDTLNQTYSHLVDLYIARFPREREGIERGRAIDQQRLAENVRSDSWMKREMLAAPHRELIVPPEVAGMSDYAIADLVGPTGDAAA